MKKSLLTAACALVVAFNAQAVTVLEYDIASLPASPTASVAANSNTLGASSLNFVGSGTLTGFDAAMYASGWAASGASVSSASQRYEFSVSSDVNLTGATLSFGASSTSAYSVSLFVNDSLFGAQNFAGGSGTSDLVSYDLNSLGGQSGPVNFDIVFSGDAANFGIDTYIGGTASASRNVILDAPTTPVPEPHEYAMIAGLGLVGFAAYRRRKLAADSAQA